METMPSPSRPRRLPRLNGFTLIELVVTMTIISIAAAVALPAMLDLSPGADAGALEPVRALLLEARLEAAAAGGPVEVVIVPTSGRYQIVAHGASGVVTRSGVVPLRGARTRASADRFRVVFNPVGLGVGDTLAAEGVVLRVAFGTGDVIIER
jgi:prepilin-type N-terminal cleavage/methylation domain-containing protein